MHKYTISIPDHIVLQLTAYLKKIGREGIEEYVNDLIASKLAETRTVQAAEYDEVAGMR